MAWVGGDEICKGFQGKEFRIWRGAVSEVGKEDEERGLGISQWRRVQRSGEELRILTLLFPDADGKYISTLLSV